MARPKKVRDIRYVHRGTQSNYSLGGMPALVLLLDDGVYFGLASGYQVHPYYDNTEDTLIFISSNKRIYGLLHGNGFTVSPQRFIASGRFTEETYVEFQQLKTEGVLKHFDCEKELTFAKKPFIWPTHGGKRDDAGRPVSTKHGKRTKTMLFTVNDYEYELLLAYAKKKRKNKSDAMRYLIFTQLDKEYTQ